MKPDENHAKPDDLSPFDRFREFARRIIAVPKSEIDKQEVEYQREKKRAQKQKMKSSGR